MRNRLAEGLVLLSVAALAALTSCGGAAAGGPTSPDRAGTNAAPAVHVPWVQMNKGQRIDYMVKTVLPAMKTEFQRFDAKRFARMDCATCHGEGVADGSFALPNPNLPKLLEPDMFAKHRQMSPAMTAFMLEKVEPGMAKLLEVPEFDPATRKGLSCYNCHTRESAPGIPDPPPAEHH